MTDRKFIVVAGNIGSGKTTLSRMLGEAMGWKAHFESVSDNPYLEDFYGDMNRWSFPLQVYFLNHRFQTHKIIEHGTVDAIQDRSIYEDANIFARALFEQGNLDERDYKNYLTLYHSMISHLKAPSLVVYLRRSVPKLVERIALRGREFEQSISRDYLTRLNEYYDQWYDNYDLGPIVKIETDHMDFVKNKNDLEQIVAAVENKFGSNLNLNI